MQDRISLPNRDQAMPNNKKIASRKITSCGLHFDRFFLAGPQGPLCFDDQVVNLQKKPLALLWALASRSGEVLTKEELLETLWPRVVVTEGVIGACLKEVRRALSDDARKPKFIATAHGIGYRFIVKVRSTSQLVDDEGHESVSRRDFPGEMAPLVGRQHELTELQAAYSRALAGQRQLVFVSGEAGIGKTSLVRDFILSLQQVRLECTDHLRVGHGQCIEHYGSGEAFLPLLEAITRLCQQPGGQAVLGLLKRYAPTWLCQLPGLLGQDASTGDTLVAATGSLQRMLREMTEVIDAAAAEQPLVLVFEDLHWSDASTLDWLAMLALRRESARLLVIVTCREVELVVNAHPLRQTKCDLVTRSLAREIRLGALVAEHVASYMAQRMPEISLSGHLAEAVFLQSQGHPLFMVHVADDLIARAAGSAELALNTIPERVTDLIEAQLMRLLPEQLKVLEAASVAGAEFASATVSAALNLPLGTIETILETLAQRRHFVEARGVAEWRDGTISGNYRFLHDLYRAVLSEHLGAAQRIRLHAAIGARLVAAYGADSSDASAELALHFEEARERKQAAVYRFLAGKRALQRLACREAQMHASRGLALLASLSEGLDRTLELKLLLIEGAALLSLRGFGAPEVEATYTRAMELGLQFDTSNEIGPILSGLYNLYFTQAAFKQVGEICDKVFKLIQHRSDVVLEMLAHNVRGTWKFYGNDVAGSLQHVQRTLALYDADVHSSLFIEYGEDPALAAHHYAALANWVMGSPQLAVDHLASGYALARTLQHPFGEVQMLWMDAVLRLDDGDFLQCASLTARLIELCVEHEFPMWLAGGKVLRGGALAGLGKLEEAQLLTAQGLGDWRASGAEVILPHFQSVVARVQAQADHIDEALKVLDEAIAIADQTGERWYLSELHRQRAELMVRRDSAMQAAGSPAAKEFARAIELARVQGTRLFEVRAHASLAEWHLNDRRVTSARANLLQARSLCANMTASRELYRLKCLWQRTRMCAGEENAADQLFS